MITIQIDTVDLLILCGSAIVWVVFKAWVIRGEIKEKRHEPTD